MYLIASDRTRFFLLCLNELSMLLRPDKIGIQSNWSESTPVAALGLCWFIG